MSKADDEINVDEKFIKAYTDALTDDIPELWDRIDKGFDDEYKNYKSDETTLDLTKTKKSEPIVMDLAVYRKRIDIGRICNRVGNENVVSFEDAKQKRTKKKSTKWMGFVAAVLLLCIIAVPVARSGLFNNKKIEETKDADFDILMQNEKDAEDTTAACADAAEYAESAESAESANEAPAAAGMEAEDAGHNEDISGSVEFVDGEEEAVNDIGGDINNNSFDLEDESSATIVTGEIECTKGAYVLIVKKVIQNGEGELSKGDRILIEDVGDNVQLKDGEHIACDEAELASVTESSKYEKSEDMMKKADELSCEYIAILSEVSIKN